MERLVPLAAVMLLLGLAIPATATGQERVSAGFVEISADSLVFDGDGWQARGNVRLRPTSASDPQFVLTADEVASSGDSVEAKNATLRIGGDLLITAETLSFSDGAVSGTALVAAAHKGERLGVRFTGNSFRLEEGDLTLEDAQLSPCCRGETLGDIATSAGGLVVSSNTATIDLDQVDLRRDLGEVDADGVSLSVAGIPVLWTPGLTVPFDGRKAGLLPPTVGLVDEHLLVGEGVFLPLTRADDVELSGFYLDGDDTSGGARVGGALTLRHAGLDHLGQSRVSNLAVRVARYLDPPDGTEDTPFAIEGSGALVPSGAPNLRWQIDHLVSSGQLAATPRAPLSARLGGTTLSAVGIGDQSYRATFDLSAELAQPLAPGAALWSGATAPTVLDTSVVYHVRGEPLGRLLVDFDAGFSRLTPLATKDTDVLASIPVNRLVLGTGATIGISGRPGWITFAGRLDQRANVFEAGRDEVVCDEDDPACIDFDPITPSRTTAAQEVVADLSVGVGTGWIGHPGGVRHHLAVEAIGHVLPLHLTRGEVDTVTISAPLARLYPEQSVVAALDNTLGDPLGFHLDLRIAGAVLSDLTEVETAAIEEQPRVRAGARARLGTPSNHLRLESAVSDAGDPLGLSEAMMRVGAHHFVEGGFVLVGEGLRPATRTVDVAPGRPLALLPVKTDQRIAGVAANTAFPLFWSDLVVTAGAIVPVLASELAPADFETELGLHLGNIAGCASVGVVASRRTAPEAVDIWLQAALGSW